MEVPPFLRLVELGTNRHGRPVPPKTAEDVRGSSRLPAEARKYQVAKPLLVEVALHFETTATIRRHSGITDERLGARIAEPVPVLTVWLTRQSLSGFPKRPPRRKTGAQSRICVGWIWP